MDGLRIAIIALLLVLAVALAAQAEPLRSADQTNVVVESNEGNNCLAAAATVRVTR